MKEFTDLPNPRDLAKLFDTVNYTKWNAFRESDASRYVGLTLPRVLVRLPYGPNTEPVESFSFTENVNGKDHSKYLWSNAVWALGARLTDAFAKYAWCEAIRGIEGGGLVEKLPTHTFQTDDGDIALKCPTEVAITERREHELSQLGFIPIVHYEGTGHAVFYSTQSVQKPKKYDKDSANANAQLSTQLQYIMVASRFAHYLTAMMRDKIGSFMSRNECETFLNRWIDQYVTGNDDAGQDLKARYPLREAQILVHDRPGKPGAYTAVARLRIHLPLNELAISLRLVVKLPQAKG